MSIDFWTPLQPVKDRSIIENAGHSGFGWLVVLLPIRLASKDHF
jgi:hypothetical protein